MRKLPLDLSTFSEMKRLNCIYVDKTEHMYNMISDGRRYFLSRPRRFGKSLLISTLKEILSGNKQLFDDLWIGQSDYKWHEHGVIQLDFSMLTAKSVATFTQDLYDALIAVAQSYNITLNTTRQDPNSALIELSHQLFKRFNKVAILIDEYDSQILKTLHNPELAKEIRNEIQQFFTTIKGLDAQIQFVFITGVSSFARAGLFSGMNNLQIITLQSKYATICGYTDDEVDHYFEEYMTAWANQKNISYSNLRKEIKNWYNGYSFGDNVPKVYNPFSLMNALNITEFENFWFQSGAPTFLIDILKTEYLEFDPDDLEASADSLGIFDVDAIPVVPLMFQTGYLTIVSRDPDTKLYTLDYPNAEVRVSFQKYLLEIFAHLDAIKAAKIAVHLFKAFNQKDIEKAIELLQQLFAHIPYQLHSKQEKFYHSLLVMACICGGIKAQSEYSTSHGRIDLVLDLPNFLYIVEIKFNQSADNALAQIKERRYYERFTINNDKPIILLGLSFNRQPSDFTITYAVENLT